MKVASLTSLRRQATKILAELRTSKEPVLIMKHGKPSAYLVDVQNYEFMQRRLALLEALSKGEQAMSDNKVMTHPRARKRMAKWLSDQDCTS